jgi:predicted GIY-YIG superfamily endonuclease
MSYVYLLESSLTKSTYVGATVNLDRRLRQHNKEISGGAVATGVRVAKGETWERPCYVEGFPTWNTALQFEWRWKQISRKLDNKISPMERRMMALKKLINLDKPTTKAIPYCDWETPINIVFNNDLFKHYYDSIEKID